MSIVNLVLFAALVLVGVRVALAGLRGIRGEIGVRYGWPFNMFVSHRPAEEQNQINQAVLKFGSVARLLFGLVMATIGMYLLWFEVAK